MSIPKKISAWVDALRSGKYKQGNGHLCYKDTKAKRKRYCCLGVLCDLDDSVKAKLSDSLTDHNNKLYTYEFPNDNHAVRTDAPPDAYCEELGLTPQMVSDLIDLNDKLKVSFKQIADVVEKTFKARKVSDREGKLRELALKLETIHSVSVKEEEVANA